MTPRDWSDCRFNDNTISGIGVKVGEAEAPTISSAPLSPPITFTTFHLAFFKNKIMLTSCKLLVCKQN